MRKLGCWERKKWLLSRVLVLQPHVTLLGMFLWFLVPGSFNYRKDCNILSASPLTLLYNSSFISKKSGNNDLIWVQLYIVFTFELTLLGISKRHYFTWNILLQRLRLWLLPMAAQQTETWDPGEWSENSSQAVPISPGIHCINVLLWSQHKCLLACTRTAAWHVTVKEAHVKNKVKDAASTPGSWYGARWLTVSLRWPNGT